MDEESGMGCKGRFDAYHDGLGELWDVKTTGRSAGPAGFRRSIAEFGYDFQGAMYRRGLYACGKPCNKVGLIVIEADPRANGQHAIGVYRMSERCLAKADLEVTEALRRVAEYIPSDGQDYIYPPYEVEIEAAW
jgi:hypothetical protein